MSSLIINVPKKEISEAKNLLIARYGDTFSPLLFDKLVKLLQYFWIKPGFRKNQAKYVLEMGYRMALKENIILQAPTGVGKTTMGITAAIIGAMRPEIVNDIIKKSNDLTIYFAGRTIEQSKRVIEEINEFNLAMGRQKPKLIAIQLNAKDRMCLETAVKEKDKEADDDEKDDLDTSQEDAVFGLHGRCAELRRKGKCSYYPTDDIELFKENQSGIFSLSSVPDSFVYFKNYMRPIIERRKLLYPYNTGFDGDELVKLGKQNHICPYFLAIGVVQLADFVTGPYIWLTQPNLREFIFSIMRDNQKFLIIDECHNFPDQCSDENKVSFSRNVLLMLIKRGLQHRNFYQKEYDMVKKQADKDKVKLFDSLTDKLEYLLDMVDESANELKRKAVGNFYEYNQGIFKKNMIIAGERGKRFQTDIAGIMKFKRPKGLKIKVEELFEYILKDIKIVIEIFESMKKNLTDEKEFSANEKMIEDMVKSIDKDIKRFNSFYSFFEIKDDIFVKYMASSYALFIDLYYDDDQNGPVYWTFEWQNYNPALSSLSLFAPNESHSCGSLGLTGTFHEQTYASKMGFLVEGELIKNPLIKMKTEGLDEEKIIKIVPFLHQLEPFPFPFNPDHFSAKIVMGSALESKIRNKYLSQIAKQLAELHNETMIRGIGKNKIFFLSSKALLGDFLRTFKNEFKKINPSSFKNLKTFNEAEIDGIKENNILIEEFKLSKNAIWFGVMGGRNSEGQDFPPDLLDTVAIIGLPLEAMNDAVNQRSRKYEILYEFPKNIAQIYAYYVPAMIKTGQAIGRLIRSDSTRGFILLYDDRFIRYTTLLPKWFEKEVKLLPGDSGQIKYIKNIYNEANGKKLFGK